jgi:hemin uptake protein HemP
MTMTMSPDDKNTPSERTPATRTAGTARKIDLVGDRLESRDLFVGTREITIGHSGDTYRLRLTAQNKLILTK